MTERPVLRCPIWMEVFFLVGKGYNVSETARMCNFEQVTAYNNMRRLREKGFFEKEGNKRGTKYTLTPKGMLLAKTIEVFIDRTFQLYDIPPKGFMRYKKIDEQQKSLLHLKGLKRKNKKNKEMTGNGQTTTPTPV